MVGPDHDLGQKAQSDELEADDDEQHRQEKERPVAEAFIEKEPFVRHEHGQARAQKSGQKTEKTENLQRAGRVTLQKFDGHEVEENARGPENGVLGAAPAPRPVVDGNLGQNNAQARGDGGNEAVHLAVETEILDDFPAEGFEGASVVVQFDSGDPGDQPVGDHGGNAAGQPPVLAVLSPAADDVEPGFDFFQKMREIGRVVLKIRVHGDDDLAPGVFESGRYRGGLAEILPEADDPHSGIGGADILEDGERCVGASVVDE